jgi:FAD:protein FMN transferase
VEKFLSALILFILTSCHSQNGSTSFQGEKMTLSYRIIIAEKLSLKEKKQIQTVIDILFDEIDTTANPFNPHSEISTISNASTKKPIAISPMIAHLLSLSEKISNLTCQRFDPCCLPQKKGGSHLYLFDKNTIRKKVEDLHFDFCGIVKGYFLDLLAQKLKEMGYSHFLLEWAGELVVSGHPKGKKAWMISINGTEIIPMNKGAIATSGSGGLIGAKMQTHIYDPLEGKNINLGEHPIVSVTVSAPLCSEADAIATALMTFNSKEKLTTFAKKLTHDYPEICIWVQCLQ